MRNVNGRKKNEKEWNKTRMKAASELIEKSIAARRKNVCALGIDA
jgi:hypothetical protein